MPLRGLAEVHPEDESPKRRICLTDALPDPWLLRAEVKQLRQESGRLLVDCIEARLTLRDTRIQTRQLRQESRRLFQDCVQASHNLRDTISRTIELLHAARSLEGACGLGPMSPSAESNEAHAAGPAETIPLTAREVEVLKHIVEGHSTKAVAGILRISFKTAACHRYRIMSKLGIQGTTALVKYAIRQGLARA